MCDGMFHNDFIANLPLSLSVKEFWKSVHIWRSYRQNYSGMFFWLTVYKEITSYCHIKAFNSLGIMWANIKRTFSPEYLCSDGNGCAQWWQKPAAIMGWRDDQQCHSETVCWISRCRSPGNHALIACCPVQSLLPAAREPWLSHLKHVIKWIRLSHVPFQLNTEVFCHSFY